MRLATSGDDLTVRMNVHTVHPRGEAPPAHRRRPGWEARIAVVVVLVFGAALSGVLLFALSGSSQTLPIQYETTIPPSQSHPVRPFPIGIANASEPSGMAPTAAAVPGGYVRTYASDFLGNSLPAGWEPFTGVPGGDPGGQFAATHVTVAGGMLELNAWRDPAYAMKWVTGGLCHCGHPQLYGAYFVRSRVTGPGPNDSQLLWPVGNIWPPEIDFNETGATDLGTSWTVHWGADNSIQQGHLRVDMTQWHTWGVIWTPTVITFTVDGLLWGRFTIPSAISTLPMTLDLQQRTGCTTGFVCPTAPESMLVDWVTEYTHA